MDQRTFNIVCHSIPDASFPTPMEEPKKVIRCHYLGAESVSKPTGKVPITDVFVEFVPKFVTNFHIIRWLSK